MVYNSNILWYANNELVFLGLLLTNIHITGGPHLPLERAHGSPALCSKSFRHVSLAPSSAAAPDWNMAKKSSTTWSNQLYYQQRLVLINMFLNTNQNWLIKSKIVGNLQNMIM